MMDTIYYNWQHSYWRSGDIITAIYDMTLLAFTIRCQKSNINLQQASVTHCLYSNSATAGETDTTDLPVTIINNNAVIHKRCISLLKKL